jgi:hypothetical protein
MCSAKGSPGVTVSALAFTLVWGRRVVLAECDPAGGDLAAGYLHETALGERGLARLAGAARRGRLAELFWTQLVDLAPARGAAMSSLVLPGITDASQAAGLVPIWEQLAAHFAALRASGYDVIADCGRIASAHTPVPVLVAADLVLLVARPTLPSINAAAGGIVALRGHGVDRLALLLVGDGAYRDREVSAQLRTPVVARVPFDPTAATVLSTGGELHRARLLTAAGQAAKAVWNAAAGAPAAVAVAEAVGRV